MQKKILKKANIHIKEKRPILYSEKYCDYFKTGDILEICFYSGQCINDFNGSCIMCDYGKFNSLIELDKYTSRMKEILLAESKNMKYLLLCCNGSFFNDKQIPFKLFENILLIANESTIPYLIFEVHYLDISEEKLKFIQEHTKKQIVLEIGLETSNQLYHDEIIMKNINIDEFTKKINMIKKYRFYIDLNILFGLPFLSLKEQIEDTINTIKYTINLNCTPIIFPINIKPYTLLNFLYKEGLYEEISLWDIIIIMTTLNDNELNKIVITWYGNRDDMYYDNMSTVFPQSCKQCNKELIIFFKSFLKTNNISDKRKLLNNLILNTSCNCYSKRIKKLYTDNSNFSNKLEIACKKIEKSLLNNEV